MYKMNTMSQEFFVVLFNFPSLKQFSIAAAATYFSGQGNVPVHVCSNQSIEEYMLESSFIFRNSVSTPFCLFRFIFRT